MTIPDPKVTFHSPCEILINNRWVRGEVSGLEYTNHHGEFHWAYYVSLKSQSGTLYRRWGCDDSVRKVK